MQRDNCARAVYLHWRAVCHGPTDWVTFLKSPLTVQWVIRGLYLPCHAYHLPITKISKKIKFSFLVDFPTFNTEDMKCDLTVCTGHCGLCGVFMIYCVWGLGANCLKVHLMLSCFLASSENSSYNVSNKHRQHSRISIYFCFWNFN